MTTTAAAVFLVITNLALFPALYYSAVAGLFVELGLLLGVFVASTAFHICQVQWFCFGVSLFSLQVTDHTLVYVTVIYLSLYFVNTPLVSRVGVTLFTLPIIQPVIITFLHEFVSGALAVAIAAVAAMVALIVILSVYGHVYFDWRSVLVAAILVAGGIVLHVVGGDFSPNNNAYGAAHSVWHVLAMVAIYFILDIPYSQTSVLKFWHLIVHGKHKPKAKRKMAKQRREDYDAITIDVVESMSSKSKVKSKVKRDRSRKKREKKRQRRARDDAVGQSARYAGGGVVYAWDGEVIPT